MILSISGICLIIPSITSRIDIIGKLQKLKEDPRQNTSAHPLHGKLTGKWSCWLGSNLRMVYTINDSNKIIEVESVGSHKIY